MHKAALAALASYSGQAFWPTQHTRLMALMRETIITHGDAARWEEALATLPRVSPGATYTRPQQTSGHPVIGIAGSLPGEQLEHALRGLHPWRKGPWSLFGLHIDTEWRSDWKWQRLAPYLPNLTGQRILDVGCGNGYYGWHMLNAGAREVIGIDPTLLFFYQHLAMAFYLSPLYANTTNQVLPLRLEDLTHPDAGQQSTDNHDFDSVFSMGVLYHRRDPLEHLRELQAQLRPGGTLILETLVCDTHDLEPEGRYARMRNVHLVPQPSTVSRWLAELGFDNCQACDITTTEPSEQRSTGWMHFESLQESLDPAHPELTVEGHPAPVRACFVAHWSG